MPNGVSCAYFALKNWKIGTTEHNVFREGISCCQTVRTADAISKSGVLHSLPSLMKNSETAASAASSSAAVTSSAASTGASVLSKAAKFARKIVYPLIIGSGIYNTVKSDDKVRTGAMQAGGITTMYAFEQVAERALKTINTKLSALPIVQNNKAAKFALYVLKGASFAAASILGFEVGKNGAKNLVDNIRYNKAKKQVKNNSAIFDDIKLK